MHHDPRAPLRFGIIEQHEAERAARGGEGTAWVAGK